jgi:diguanylate cyclase (GGDEF)-like protein
MSERLNNEILEQLSAGLQKLVVADFVSLDERGAPPEAGAAFSTFNKLSKMLREVTDFSRALAEGNVSVAPPPRSNYLAMGLKVIHNQLMHIIWQAEQIAAGDYSQRIDFMGDFGRTFNWAVESLRKQREEFDANRAMMTDLFNSLHSVIVLIDPEAKKILFYNDAAEAVRKGHTDLKTEKRDGLLAYLYHLCEEPPETEEDIIYLDARMNCWFKIGIADIRWTENKAVKLFNCLDVTREQTEYELMKEAAFDALTGLCTRNQGIPKIEALFRGLGPAQYLCVAFFDLDGLKRVNDTLGHSAGDNLIRRFASALKKTFRAGDVMIRMGGDEFLAAFTGSEEKVIAEVLQRFADNVEAENKSGEIRLEYSEGHAKASYQDQATVAQIIEKADAQMYSRKKARKIALGLNINDRL